MGVKYAYYRCQNDKCPSPVNIRRQDFENGFVDFLRQQQPDANYLRLFHKVVVDVWAGKQASALVLIRTFENQINELKDRKEKLRNAFVYQQAISRDDYEEMRAKLNDELATAELNLGQGRADEVEVEKVVEFAEDLLLNTAGAWQRCSLEQKQRLQQVLFPLGVEYADGLYRTQERTFLFKGLGEIGGGEEIYGSATGNRTRV